MAPGSARAAARVAHYPPTMARGPMALALRLVRNEIMIIIKKTGWVLGRCLLNWHLVPLTAALVLALVLGLS